jgi:hypothetical protein
MTNAHRLNNKGNEYYMYGKSLYLFLNKEEGHYCSNSDN